MGANPPTQWSDTKNVRWKVPIPGRGSGSPVIWGDQVFVVTAAPTAGGNQQQTQTQDTPQRQRGRRPQGRVEGSTFSRVRSSMGVVGALQVCV